jgi:hypothetical protein
MGSKESGGHSEPFEELPLPVGSIRSVVRAGEPFEAVAHDRPGL